MNTFFLRNLKTLLFLEQFEEKNRHLKKASLLYTTICVSNTFVVSGNGEFSPIVLESPFSILVIE